MSSPPRALPRSVNGWQGPYMDAQYESYLKDPQSVAPDVRAFFQGLELGLNSSPSGGPSAAEIEFQTRVDDLINAYRTLGHHAAHLDPFDRKPDRPDALNLAHWHLTEGDLDRVAHPGSVVFDGPTTLGNIIDRLETAYCRGIGAEIMHVQNTEEREWLVRRFEQVSDGTPLPAPTQRHILELLTQAEMFEKFLAKRYPGEKRFSLEGAETLIPMLEYLIREAAQAGVEEIVLGMAHRGRLNVLNNILGKTYGQIFTEFEESWDEDFIDGGGDVKYHRGYSGDRKFDDGTGIRLAMASNPSHLEAVDAVVQGRTRAKQRLRGDKRRQRVMAALIHGDAAIAGQGMVQEVLNLSQLDGYTTGGTVHIVVNNLIGFTTAPEDSRSTKYCTDVAKMINAPVFHVNGEYPEAAVAVAQLALEYRKTFNKDVVLDMICYRRYGHNEQDEASFTNPLLYKLIKDQPSTLAGYAHRLLEGGMITEAVVRQVRDRLDHALETAQEEAKRAPMDPVIDPGSQMWLGKHEAFSFEPVDTSVTRGALEEICAALGRVPDGFNLNRKLQPLLDGRAALLETGRISYADAESLAYGTLLLDGVAVRLSGQDCRRGTFSHRHAVLRDQETGEAFTPLNSIREVGLPGTDKPVGSTGADGKARQAQLCIHDSPLSEQSVLGFEYGYSLADPTMLVIWEAQFGDFNNGAQVIIDQFLASAEMKWDRWSGITLLLPHGYEGAGPEHSSARMERFLQLCGNNNLQVVYPSTAAQTFHMFRRQMIRPFRKPLIVMTPKSMLRTPTSDIRELMEGRFWEILDDPRFVAGGGDRKKVTTLAMCSGKIYHELAERRDEIGREDIALVRVEQPYPFHLELAKQIVASYPHAKRFVWVQEEPRNAGAFMYMSDVLQRRVGLPPVEYIGREISATPAVGSKSQHKKEQESILERAVGAKPAQKSQPARAMSA